MLINSPPSAIDAEVLQHQLRCLERAVPVVQRDPHAVIPEANNVGAPITGQISKETWVIKVPIKASHTHDIPPFSV